MTSCTVLGLPGLSQACVAVARRLSGQTSPAASGPSALYDKAALPHDLPQLRRAFDLALSAGLEKAEKIPEPRRSEVLANLQQFMLDAAKPARLLLEIKDGVSREDRIPSIMAN
jgi:hypothetical protein